MTDEPTTEQGDAVALATPESFHTDAKVEARAPAPEPTPKAPAAAPVLDPQAFYSIYDLATGRVRVTGHCPASMLELQQHDADQAMVLETLDYRTQYVDTTLTSPAGRPRPTFTGFDKATVKADGADTAVMPLPVAATVTIDGIAYDVPADAEGLHFTADTVGPYAITVSAWPYQDLATTITGAAA